MPVDVVCSLGTLVSFVAEFIEVLAKNEILIPLFYAAAYKLPENTQKTPSIGGGIKFGIKAPLLSKGLAGSCIRPAYGEDSGVRYCSSLCPCSLVVVKTNFPFCIKYVLANKFTLWNKWCRNESPRTVIRNHMSSVQPNIRKTRPLCALSTIYRADQAHPARTKLVLCYNNALFLNKRYTPQIDLKLFIVRYDMRVYTSTTAQPYTLRLQKWQTHSSDAEMSSLKFGTAAR